MSYEQRVWTKLCEIERLLKEQQSNEPHLVDSDDRWVNTNEAAKRLGVSAERLRRMRRDRFLRAGWHYRTVSGPQAAIKPHRQYHVGRCAEVLNTDPARRKFYSRGAK
jgi:hypothetical protein